VAAIDPLWRKREIREKETGSRWVLNKHPNTSRTGGQKEKVEGGGGEICVTLRE